MHSWSVRGFLFELPSFILRKTIGEIGAILCYHLSVALFETAIFMLALLTVAALLPAAWLRQGFPYKGFLVFAAAAAAVIILQTSPAYETTVFALQNDPGLPLKIIAAVGTGMALYLLAHWKVAVRNSILVLVDHISIMLYIYLPLDAVALVVVAARLAGWIQVRA